MSKKKQPFNEWKHEVSFDMWQGELQNYEDGGEVSASSSPSFWERTFGGSNDGSPSGLAAYEGYTQEDAVRDAGFANVAEAQALGKSLENITPRDILEFVPVVGDLLGAEEIYRELQKAEPNWTLVGILGGATVIGLVPGAGDAAASAIKAGARKAASITGTATADVIGAARALADGDLTGHLVEHRGSKSSSQGSSVGARAAARNDYLIVDPTTGEHIPFKSDALVEDIVAATGADKKSFSKPRARGVGTTKPFEGYPAGTKIFRADQPPTKSPVVKTTPTAFHEVNVDDIRRKERLVSGLEPSEQRRLVGYTDRRRALLGETPFREVDRPQAIQDAVDNFDKRYATPEAKQEARVIYDAYDADNQSLKAIEEELRGDFEDMWEDGLIADAYESDIGVARQTTTGLGNRVMSEGRVGDKADPRQARAWVSSRMAAIKDLKAIQRAETRPVRSQQNISDDFKKLDEATKAFKVKHGVEGQRRLATSWKQEQRDAFRKDVDETTYEHFTTLADDIDWSDPKYDGYALDPRYGFTRVDSEGIPTGFVNNNLNKEFALKVSDAAWPDLQRRMGLQSQWSELYKDGDDLKRALEFAHQRSSYSFGLGQKPEKFGYKTQLWDDETDALVGTYDYKVDFTKSLADRLGVKDDFAGRGNVPTGSSTRREMKEMDRADNNAKRLEARKVQGGKAVDEQSVVDSRNVEQRARETASKEVAATRTKFANESVANTLSAAGDEAHLESLVIQQFGDMSTESIKKAMSAVSGQTIYRKSVDLNDLIDMVVTRNNRNLRKAASASNQAAEASASRRLNEVLTPDQQTLRRAQLAERKAKLAGTDVVEKNMGGAIRKRYAGGGFVEGDAVEEIVDGAHIPDTIPCSLPEGAFIVNAAAANHPKFKRELLSMGGEIIAEGFQPRYGNNYVDAIVGREEIYLPPPTAQRYSDYLEQVNDYGRAVKQKLGTGSLQPGERR